MREDFERWYLQVVRGHPANLLKDESGGYKYLAAMYLGWEAATLIERERCAKLCDEYAVKHANVEDDDNRSAQAWMMSQCAAQIRMRSNALGNSAGACARPVSEANES